LTHFVAILLPSKRAKRSSRPWSRTRVAHNGDENSFEDQGDEDGDDDDIDAKEYDSDALDDDSDTKPSKEKKRKGVANSSPTKKATSPRKRRKAQDEDDDEDEEFELKEGQEIVGIIVQAPKKGRGAPHFPAISIRVD
jgi:hypothetical protein